MSKSTFRLDGIETPVIDYKINPDKPNLYQKICIIMQKVNSVYKDTKVQTSKTSSYKAVSHDNVAALLHPHLAEHGIVVRPSVISRNFECAKVVTEYDGKKSERDQFRTHLVVDVAFINADNPNERESCIVDGFALDSQDKGTGKALSYAVKYAMLKMFVLESSDEEEKREPEFETSDTKPLGGLRDKDEKQKSLDIILNYLSTSSKNMNQNEKLELMKELTGKTHWPDVMALNKEELKLIINKMMFRGE